MSADAQLYLVRKALEGLGVANPACDCLACRTINACRRRLEHAVLEYEKLLAKGKEGEAHG